MLDNINTVYNVLVDRGPMSKMEERNTLSFSTQVVIQKQGVARCFWVTTWSESATMFRNP